MKIGILTFNRAYNYGAVLQSFALNNKINSLKSGCSELIDYYPDYFFYFYNKKKAFFLFHPPIRTWVYHYLLKDVINERNQGFESFISRSLLSKPLVKNHKGLKSVSKNFDKFIVGSDQVWNDKCAKFDVAFFLPDSIFGSKKKYSYAASFGFDEIPKGLEDEYLNRLQGFEELSVREASGKHILESLGLDSQVHCDPTLLLTANEWNCLTKPVNENYILVYYVKKTAALQKAAEELKLKTGLPIIVLPCNMSYDSLSGKRDRTYADKVETTASPERFLSLIKNADYVLTNSFHGTVFSLVFHKPFLTVVNDGINYNNRAETLLQYVGCDDRTINNLENIDVGINWNYVDVQIAKIRKDSIEYLQSIIES